MVSSIPPPQLERQGDVFFPPVLGSCIVSESICKHVFLLAEQKFLQDVIIRGEGSVELLKQGYEHVHSFATSRASPMAAPICNTFRIEAIH